MELWDLKANALRLMFSDTDIQFNKEDFINESIYTNGNTRDKLVRMNDSIRRAIDLYYQYCGQYASKKKVKYTLDNEGKPTNILDISSINDFGYPDRIDLLGSKENAIRPMENLEYYYHGMSKTIEVEFEIPYRCSIFSDKYMDFSKFEFMLYFKYDKINLPNDVDELTFDLDSMYIPSDVQRMIPKYVKGEIYEEDEYAMAQLSKNEYIQFLVSYSKKFSNVQTRVKSIHRRR